MAYDLPKHRYATAIHRRGLTIYDPIDVGDSDLWIPRRKLETILGSKLRGADLGGLPLRTRSKVAKEIVCRALGYPVPRSFKKTQPRFPGQHFDIYVQKANNLQIWNEAIEPSRRYVLIRVNRDDTVSSVKVLSGSDLAVLDRTGTLTKKYQARMLQGEAKAELATKRDTERVRRLISPSRRRQGPVLPTAEPTPGAIRPIEELLTPMAGLLGTVLPHAAGSQERVRGGLIHEHVCFALGYSVSRDDGRYPDIRNQLLEIKLQLSPTIDLGLICPDSEQALEFLKCGDTLIRPYDVRYAVFGAELYGPHVLLSSLCLVIGRDFLERFPLMEGKTVNRKLQIPLPSDFFNR